uniref:Uncharacterized protein n=1 Tax=Tanacetum cinerariifolium TaxID=118510 RepID=A0A6L2L5G5_TANCI|nr:hypothetical protein [Tanacetum cinerariifolium]
MSSASSAVTTSVYTDSEPGRVFCGADEDFSDGGLEECAMWDGAIAHGEVGLGYLVLFRALGYMVQMRLFHLCLKEPSAWLGEVKAGDDKFILLDTLLLFVP